MLYQTLSAPISCQIELTTGCNNDCLYCYNHWRHDKKTPGSNLRATILDQTINQLIENKVFQVTFTGGETLLRKKELFRGIERLIANDISCAVNSNLTLLTDKDAETLYRLGLRGILTSVCSSNPATHDLISQRDGAFNETVVGIKRALNAGLSVAASMVLTSLNAKDVVSTGLALKEIGVRQIFATKASPPVNASGFARYMITRAELMEALDGLNTLKLENGMDVGILECYPLCAYGKPATYPFVADRRCSAGITTCTIGASGDIRPCSHSDVSYGNISGDGLITAWMAMGDQRDGSLLPQTCKDCRLLPNCSGGCRVDALCCSGKYDALDPYADPAAVAAISATDPPVDLIDEMEQLHVNHDLRIREEAVGVLCADRSMMGTPALLTLDTYDLVKALGDKHFTAQDIATYTGLAPENARQLCGILTRDKVFRSCHRHSSMKGGKSYEYSATC